MKKPYRPPRQYLSYPIIKHEVNEKRLAGDLVWLCMAALPFVIWAAVK